MCQGLNRENHDQLVSLSSCYWLVLELQDLLLFMPLMWREVLNQDVFANGFLLDQRRQCVDRSFPGYCEWFVVVVVAV